MAGFHPDQRYISESTLVPLNNIVGFRIGEAHTGTNEVSQHLGFDRFWNTIRDEIEYNITWQYFGGEMSQVGMLSRLEKERIRAHANEEATNATISCSKAARASVCKDLIAVDKSRDMPWRGIVTEVVWERVDTAAAREAIARDPAVVCAGAAVPVRHWSAPEPAAKPANAAAQASCSTEGGLIAAVRPAGLRAPPGFPTPTAVAGAATTSKRCIINTAATSAPRASALTAALVAAKQRQQQQAEEEEEAQQQAEEEAQQEEEEDVAPAFVPEASATTEAFAATDAAAKQQPATAPCSSSSWAGIEAAWEGCWEGSSQPATCIGSSTGTVASDTAAAASLPQQQAAASLAGSHVANWAARVCARLIRHYNRTTGSGSSVHTKPAVAVIHTHAIPLPCAA